jgi:uncharacterized surface protein with fasciclin (FAS1) repeats
MKIKQVIVPLALQVGLLASASWAQTTPVGTATPTTYPIGAVAPDSNSGSKTTRSQKRAMKREQNRMKQNARGTSASNTSTQDAQYRESASSNGTAVNNSNSTNYNSNNVTNAPTGAGSNPNATATPAASGDVNTSGSSTNMNGTSTNTDVNSGTRKTGTAAAVTGARMTEEPAVKAGTTVRNTSVGDFIASSPNYVTLQNALQSAELDQTLKGSGPYTLFAPSNDAFKKLPSTVQSGLLEGRNRDALKQLLTYHVVNGSLSAEDLTQQIKSGNGKAQLKTLAGTTLTAKMGSGGKVTLTDEQGTTVTVDNTDMKQSNGVVHGISAVLLPKGGTSSFR